MTPDLISPLNADAEMQNHYSSNPLVRDMLVVEAYERLGLEGVTPLPLSNDEVTRYNAAAASLEVEAEDALTRLEGEPDDDNIRPLLAGRLGMAIRVRLLVASITAKTARQGGARS